MPQNGKPLIIAIHTVKNVNNRDGKYSSKNVFASTRWILSFNSTLHLLISFFTEHQMTDKIYRIPLNKCMYSLNAFAQKVLKEVYSCQKNIQISQWKREVPPAECTLKICQQ